MDWNFLIQNNDSISVSTDSRNILKDNVFFALHGASFNGNQFALQAIEQGASYVVVDEDITCPQIYSDKVIRVEDTLLALQDLARQWRRKWGKTVIGITGTNGKTTTKELTATVLNTEYNVHYTKGNLNNQIGVPLTLLQLRADHDLAIIEMGASHIGDIQELVTIAEPDCGIITNVGKAHLQGFGSFEGVQQTKKELYDYLRAHDGFIFRNLDNPYLEKMAGDLKTIGYHTGEMPEGTHLIGNYNAENISAALCIGEYFGIDREQGLNAIRDYIPTNNRSQLRQTAHNTVIVDAYNANPTSMRASLLSFIAQPYPTHAFILGDMLELGEQSHLEHQNIVNLLAEQKADNVYLVGSEFAHTTAPYPVFANAEQLGEYLRQHPLSNLHILLKGSRGIHLETILDIL